MDIAIFAPATKRFTMVVEGNSAKAPKQYKRCIGHDGRDKSGWESATVVPQRQQGQANYPFFSLQGVMNLEKP
jgi:hypothetical protein